MKAFIFNSGSGFRMEELTKSNPKALVELSNGETILSRQIRLLKKAGIYNVIITTGPFEDQIIKLSNNFPDVQFTFVNNSKYDETNSIFSLYLSKEIIDDDLIILHGDLVFDAVILDAILNSDHQDLCLISTNAKLSEKDFKGRIIDGKLREISVKIFDDNCYALQPLYKLSKVTMKKWLNEIETFIKQGKNNVYAEYALNNILYKLSVSFLDYKEFYIEEIDNKDDLHRVSNEFRYFDYKNQKVIESNNYLAQINEFIAKNIIKSPFIVYGKHLLNDSSFSAFINTKNVTTFKDYSSNPKYEEVLKGVEVFRNSRCDSIIAIGGGSCIDVAKTIKLFSGMNGNYINETPKYIDIPLLVIPTTAGTGTESTRYSVIYYNDEKQSLMHDCLLPDICILNEKFLYSMPEYHKRSSLLDAFCQAIEAYWSINSNELSKDYSKKAITLILNNYQKYLNNDLSTYSNILRASNFSGKAINITQTTAPHAMSYKITSLLGIAHGHAVSIMLPHVLDFMLNNLELVQDKRGKNYVSSVFDELSDIFGVENHSQLNEKIKRIINEFKLESPVIDEKTLHILSNSVNPIRLKNNPIAIDADNALRIYQCAFI